MPITLCHKINNKISKKCDKSILHQKTNPQLNIHNGRNIPDAYRKSLPPPAAHSLTKHRDKAWTTKFSLRHHSSPWPDGWPLPLCQLQLYTHCSLNSLHISFIKIVNFRITDQKRTSPPLGPPLFIHPNLKSWSKYFLTPYYQEMLQFLMVCILPHCTDPTCSLPGVCLLSKTGSFGTQLTSHLFPILAKASVFSSCKWDYLTLTESTYRD